MDGKYDFYLKSNLVSSQNLELRIAFELDVFNSYYRYVYNSPKFETFLS